MIEKNLLADTQVLTRQKIALPFNSGASSRAGAFNRLLLHNCIRTKTFALYIVQYCT